MNITTIIPIHEFSEEIEKLFTSALASVSDQQKLGDVKPKVLIVYAKALNDNQEFTKFLSNLNKDNKYSLLSPLQNDGDSDFQSQINFAVSKIDTDWFSILEFDDELSTTYYKQALHHIEKLDKVDLILPILLEVNEDNDALKFTNETVWSKQFVGENGQMGYLNAQALNQYTDFKFSGGVFKKSEFEAVGGLKTNIKLTFTYEFLLRMLNNGATIYTLPKIGVKHFATREGSLFDEYGKTLSLQERKFWFNTAKKESNFFNDRVIDMSLLEAQ